MSGEDSTGVLTRVKERERVSEERRGEERRRKERNISRLTHREERRRNGTSTGVATTGDETRRRRPSILLRPLLGVFYVYIPTISRR